MIIKKLLITNFLSHENTEIEIPEGVTVILGRNGAGKTSILDAITSSLFRETNRGERLEDLIRKGTSHSKLILEFSHSSRDYKVIRYIGRKGQEDQLFEANRILARGANKVNDELRNLLGFSFNSAKWTFIAYQGEFDLISLQPSERKKIISKILRIEEMQNLYSKLGESDVIEEWKNYELMYDMISNQLKSMQIEKESIESEIEKTKSRLRDLTEECRQLKDQYKKLEEEELMLSRLKGIYEQTLNQLRDKESVVEVLKGEVKDMSYDIERLEKELIDYEKNRRLSNAYQIFLDLKRLNESIINYKERLDEYRRKINEVSEKLRRKSYIYTKYLKYSEFQRKKESLASEISMLRQRKEEKEKKEKKIKELFEYISKYDEKKKEKDKIEIIFNHLDEELREIKSNRISKEREKQEKEEILKLIRSSEATKCPICGSKMESKEEMIKHIINSIVRLESEIAELKERERNLESNRVKNERELRNLEKEISKIERMKEELKTYLTELKEYENIEDIIRERERDLDETVNNLEKLKEFYDEYISLNSISEEELNNLTFSANRIETEMRKLYGEKEEKEKELMKLCGEEVCSEEVLREADSKFKIQSLKRGELTRLHSEIGKKLKDIKTLENEITHLREKVREFPTDLIEKYDKVRIELVKTQERVRSINEQLESLEENLNRLEKRREEVDKQIKELNNKIEMAIKAKHVLNRLNLIRWVVSPQGAQDKIRAAYIKLVEDNLRNALNRFELGFVDVEIDSEFNVKIRRKDGQLVNAKSLSGGERMALAISMRIAITKTISREVQTLIMDEPTAYLDEERRKELVSIFQSPELKGDMRQIIIITHEPELSRLADMVIQVEKNNEISKVKISDAGGL